MVSRQRGGGGGHGKRLQVWRRWEGEREAGMGVKWRSGSGWDVGREDRERWSRKGL